MKILYVNINQTDFERLLKRFDLASPINILRIKISKFWDKLYDLMEDENLKAVCFISPKHKSVKIYTDPIMLVRCTKTITTYHSSYPTVEREFYYKYYFKILKIE